MHTEYDGPYVQDAGCHETRREGTWLSLKQQQKIPRDIQRYLTVEQSRVLPAGGSDGLISQCFVLVATALFMSDMSEMADRKYRRLGRVLEGRKEARNKLQCTYSA